MQELLFLCHRIPYPPNKGDKIRSFHLLKALSQRYRVHLGAFVDDPADWEHLDKLGPLCAEQCYRPLHPRRARLRSLAGLWRNQALSFAYYHDRVMLRWVARIMAERPIAAVVVFSSVMGPYVVRDHDARRVLDFVDVDSEKWRQYAAKNHGLAHWIYAREGRRLLAGERALAASFDASVFVSEAEAELFCQRAPETAARVSAIGNGVDSDYFDPAGVYEDPYEGHGSRYIVFTGVMDYAANVDAVVWFVESVWPLIHARQPDSVFCIVGTRPTRQVKNLARLAGVQVTGAVPDVRPYLAHACLAIAPMRIARGLQNKVLEALAMGRPVVMTAEAATGLRVADEAFFAVANDAEVFADHVIDYLEAPERTAHDEAARAYAVDYYGWDHQLERFLELVGDNGPAESRGDDEYPARRDEFVCTPSN